MATDPSLRLLPNAVHFREFQNDPVTGHHYTNTCGETALATALVCATPQTETAQEAIYLMDSMTREMMGLGWADSPNGATTAAHLMDEAVRRGFSYDKGSYISFEQPISANTLHQLLLSTAGVKPIVLEIATAGAGLPGDEPGVHYHFICVVGIDSTGYVVNDGDNAEAAIHLVTYTWAEIEKATPCAILVLDLQEGATSVGIPTGWKDDGKTLSANGFSVTQGFRDYIMSHPWDASNLPIEDVQSVSEVEEFNTSHGAGTIQRFHFSQLSWTAKDGVFVTYVGDEVKFLRAALAAAQSKPAPAPVPVLIDPSIKTALSAALNLLQPQAALADEIKTALAHVS